MRKSVSVLTAALIAVALLISGAIYSLATENESSSETEPSVTSSEISDVSSDDDDSDVSSDDNNSSDTDPSDTSSDGEDESSHTSSESSSRTSSREEPSETSSRHSSSNQSSSSSSRNNSSSSAASSKSDSGRTETSSDDDDDDESSRSSSSRTSSRKNNSKTPSSAPEESSAVESNVKNISDYGKTGKTMLLISAFVAVAAAAALIYINLTAHKRIVEARQRAQRKAKIAAYNARAQKETQPKKTDDYDFGGYDSDDSSNDGRFSMDQNDFDFGDDFLINKDNKK